MDNRIKVGIRVRPLSSAEQQQAAGDAPVNCDQANKKIVIGLDSRSRNSFAFDWCYPTASSSAGIYQEMCLPLINKVFEGYHATFFAYGQTGSGKTFTMGNSPESTDGIIQFAVNDIFEKRKACQQEGKQVTIEVSYMEIYMEECLDLLSTLGEKKKVDVRENNRGETYVEGLTQRLVHSPADFAACISHACKVRSVSKTAMNSHSSRSHAICTITVRVVTEEDTVIAKLNLVDLAGSERAKKTMATGDTLQEGININKGLLALGNVVSALSNKSKQNDTKAAAGTKTTTGNYNSNHIHVPYRESKLTRLLKDSLGGNGMTALLACVSPAHSNYDETLNTLRFASRASSIVNLAKVNHEEKTDAHVLNQEVNRLRAQLATLQEKYDELKSTKTQSTLDSCRSSRVDNINAGSFTDMLSGSTRLTTSFKSLIMHCFMEDVGIDDEILQKLKEDISTSAGLYGCEIVEEEENKLSESILEDCEISGMLDLEGLEGFNCVPPIAKVLDRLTSLESHLKKQLNTAVHASSSSTTGSSKTSGRNHMVLNVEDIEHEGEDFDNDTALRSNELNLSDIIGDSEGSMIQEISLDASEELSMSPIAKSSHSHGNSFSNMTLSSSNDPCQIQDSDNLDDSFEQQVEQLDHIQSRFNKLTNLGHHYEHMIRKLNSEISTLQNENNRLVSSDNITASTGSAKIVEPVVSEKVKNDLRQKSKELEEKVKILRKKEMEMQKIMLTKERLAKQLNEKQEQVQTYKRDKVKLMKKMQEKEVAHRVETRVLVKNDVQARQRAVKAEANAAKLSRDLSSRERFWQSKLDAKKIEMERLKTLLQKREEVKKMRNTHGMTRGSATTGMSVEEMKRANNASISWKTQDWKKKLQDIISLESKLAKCNGSMQFFLQKKRGLQQDRINVKQKMRKLRQSSPLYKELEEECKMLDSGIVLASQTIAEWQMRLNELESTIFTGMSATNDTAMNNVNTLVTQSSIAGNKTMSFKDFVQALLSNASSVNNNAEPGKEEWKYCLQTLWEQLRQSLQSLHQIQSEIRDLQMQGMDELDISGLKEDYPENDDDTGLKMKKSVKLVSNVKKINATNNSEEDDEVDDGSRLDDTFYPSEDEEADEDASDFDSDDDSDNDRKRKRATSNNARGKNNIAKSSAVALKKSQSNKRVFDEMNSSNDDANHSDASSDDEESDSDDGFSKPRKSSKQVNKRPRNTTNAKFSFVNSGSSSVDATESSEHEMMLFIQNNIVSLEEIMSSPTYFTLAVSLYDMLPAHFNIAKRSEEAEFIAVHPSMDFKKAFTAADSWKSSFPLRTNKQKDEAWAKLKNALAVFFAACVLTQNAKIDNEMFVKPVVDNVSLDHEQISLQLMKLKLKDLSTNPTIGGGVKKIIMSMEDSPLDATLTAAEEEKWNKFTVKDLKPFLSERGLPVSGTKKELVSRLVSYEVRQMAGTVPESDTAKEEAMDVDNMDILDTINNDPSIETADKLPVSHIAVLPLKDRSNYLKSLSELTSSAADFATAVVANAQNTATVTVTSGGVSKRSFRLNLDELTEELENRPMKPTVIYEEP